MSTKKPAFLISLFSTCLLACAFFISCNDGDKKEAEKPVEAPAAVVTDSPQMKSAVTETAKADSMPKADSVTLKKAGLKPVNTKP